MYSMFIICIFVYICFLYIRIFVYMDMDSCNYVIFIVAFMYTCVHASTFV